MTEEMASLGETKGVRIDLTPKIINDNLGFIGSARAALHEEVLEYGLSMTVDGNVALEIEKAHGITLHMPGFSRAKEVLDVCAKAMAQAEITGACMVLFDYASKTFEITDTKEWKLVRVE